MRDTLELRHSYIPKTKECDFGYITNRKREIGKVNVKTIVKINHYQTYIRKQKLKKRHCS